MSKVKVTFVRKTCFVSFHISLDTRVHHKKTMCSCTDPESFVRGSNFDVFLFVFFS